MPPGAFLLNAERFDLIGEIDRWMLQRAIQLLHRHAQAGHDLSLSVNLSGKTMNDVELAGELGEMLKATPIPSGNHLGRPMPVETLLPPASGSELI